MKRTIVRYTLAIIGLFSVTSCTDYLDKSYSFTGNDLQTILLLKSALLCVFRFFGLSSFDTVTTLILSRLASFLPFFEVIPEIYHIIGATKCE